MGKQPYSWGEHGLLAVILRPDEPAVANPTMATLRRGDWQPMPPGRDIRP